MIKQAFDFLWDARGGIGMFALCLFAAGAFVQWLAWIFKCGRFARGAGSEPSGRSERDVRYVLVEFFVKLIDDFRHLLALVLVLIFAGVLTTAIVKAGPESGDLTKAVEGVMATLGGLIGSIIGYYFGESAARSAKKTPTILNEAPQQLVDVTEGAAPVTLSPTITPANPPPSNLDQP